MATTTTIKTRIKNRFDTLANWQAAGVTLLPGEIALVQVTTGGTYTNPITGKNEPVMELLMKVGQNDSDGNPIAFSSLPWLSAKAADVYDWAKESDAGNVVVKYNKGTGTEPNWQSTTLLDIFKDLETAEADIAALKTGKLSDITVDQTGTGVVKSIEKDGTGKIKATSGQVLTADIADNTVTTEKITDKNVTTVKIADSAVTNEKVADDIAASKIVYSGSGSSKVTVADQLGDVTARVAGMLTAFSVDPAAPGDGVVHSITYDNTTGKFVVSYNKVQTADIADNAVTTAKIADGNVTTTKIADANVTTAKIKDANVTDAKIASGVSSDKITVKNTSDTLTTKLEVIDAAISGLQGTVAKGIIFRGEVTSAPSGTTYTLKGTLVEIPANIGDMVICGEKEYVYIASGDWKEFGDLSRVTTLEAWRNKLQKADTAVENQFVTEVDIAANGTVTINRAQPTSANIKHGTNSTVDAKLGEIDASIAALDTKASHSHDDYKNQNAFSKIVVSGQSNVEADSPTDIVNFAGSNVTIETTPSTDTVTFKVADATAGINGTAGTKGIVSLIDSVTSTSEESAATANAVRTAYDKGAEGVAAAAAIAANYVKIANDNLVTQAGSIIIFDCGGAANL